MPHYLDDYSSAGHLGRALSATRRLRLLVSAQKTGARATVEWRGSGRRGTVIDLAANRALVISAERGGPQATPGESPTMREVVAWLIRPWHAAREGYRLSTAESRRRLKRREQAPGAA